ncbi:MAG TPA: hypothetical protein VLZ11_02935 [Flavobacterium sp.]|nr:hypothetical protein [Flavobacterium sp.]
MKKNYIIIIIAILTLTSCGKSKEKLELEKAKIELERTKLELAEKNKADEQIQVSQQNAEKQKIHEQKLNVGKQKRLVELNEQLQQLPGALSQAEAQLNEVNEFHLGRSSTTKEKQIKEASNQLNEIRHYGDKLKNEIAQLEYNETFDFQKTPESLMNYMFKSAKTGNLSNFRYLCDPYAENDSDTKAICYAEMLTQKGREELITGFANGRIMGEPKIKGDKAEIEFAFGPSSSELKKMNLINRNGLWYLMSL